MEVLAAAVLQFESKSSSEGKQSSSIAPKFRKTIRRGRILWRSQIRAPICAAREAEVLTAWHAHT